MNLAPSIAARTEALAVLEPLGDTIELARAFAEVAGHGMLAGDVETTIAAGTRALEMAERFGDEPLAVRCLDYMGTVRANAGDHDGYDLVREAIHRAESAGDRYGVLRGSNNIACAFDIEWRPNDALSYLLPAMEIASSNEMAITPAYLSEEVAVASLLAGRFAEAAAAARVAIDDPYAAEQTEALALAVIGRVNARRGIEPFPALERAALLASGTDDYQVRHRIHIALAEAFWLDDRPAEARAQILTLRPFHEGHYEPWRRGEMRLWCDRLGVDTPELGAVTTAFDLHVMRRWREAAAMFEARGCPFEAADALGDSDDEQDLRRALEMLHDIGATARATHVARRLRELGARAIPRGPRATTRAHASGLTPREVEVAELLADGLSNARIADRLVLSPKTVDHHVSSVLAKLGVPTRRAVAGALRSTGDDQPGLSKHG